MDLNIWLVSGWRGVGKTPFCQKIIRQAQQSGWDVAGIISVPVYQDGEKISIWAENIRSTEKRLLASTSRQNTNEIILGKWFVQQDAIHWGNDVITQSTPCDLLVVDELGPLELESNQGWNSALKVLLKGEYKFALVVIRPELIQKAIEIFAPRQIVEITNADEIDRKAEYFAAEMLRG